MRKWKEIKIIVHKPKPENTEKFITTLSGEYARLMEAVIIKGK